MKLENLPVLDRTLNRVDSPLQMTCWVIAALVILPNLLLYSVDDIIIISLADPLRAVAIDQASNGRYSLSALCWLIRLFGGSRVDLETIGAITIVIGYAAIFAETIRLARLRVTRTEYLVGFAIFLTFGLLMDVFSFTNVWVQSGAASLALAASLSIAQSDRRFAIKVLLIGLVGGVAMGFYQTYPYMVACSLLTAFIVSHSFVGNEEDESFRKRYLPAALGALLAVGLYFATNEGLRYGQVPGFATGGRPFGAEYVRPNALPYLKTIVDALNPFQGAYAHYESRVTIIVLAISVVTALTAAARTFHTATLVLAALVAITMMLPNPTNLLMRVYWPSPRSLSPIAIFVSLIVVGASNRWSRKVWGVPFGFIALVFVSASQIVVYIDQQKLRADQEAMDFATANMIINRAYQEFPNSSRPVVMMNFNWDDNVIYHPRTFEFGESLMTTPSNRRGLFLYLSNGRVDVYPAGASDCANMKTQMSVEKRGNILFVCAKK